MPSESTRELEPTPFEFSRLSHVAHTPGFAGRVLPRPLLAQMVAFIASDVVCFFTVLSAASVFAAASAHVTAGNALLGSIAAQIGANALLLLLVLLSHLARDGHYTRRLADGAVLRAAISATIVIALCDALLRMSSGEPVIGLLRWLSLPPLLICGRGLARAALSHMGCWGLRTLLIGTPASLSAAVDRLPAMPHLGYVVVGTCSDQELTAAATSFAALRHRCLALRLDCVLILQHRGANVADMSLFGALTRLSIPHAILDVAANRSPASDGAFAPPASRPFGSCIKRGADVMLATALLCALSPLLFGIALLVQHDGGPVFYRQSRVGLGGGLFRCIKFRSMVMDGDARLNELLARDPSAAAEWLASYKLSCDPRVTPLGRILRRTSLDELPQLFNVLRGDMSLVGPRPIVPAELSKYGDATHLYLAVRPGLTGLWQVSGRSDTTYAERVRLDTWYVINWSPWLDLGILLRTIPAVLLRRGAV